ncbi:MAG: hypothetical protein DSY81_00240 [Bacillota bacterium]|nr:MAG: hypothetical protein DSY81_00240 [Bacillota bacterium]
MDRELTLFEQQEEAACGAEIALLRPSGRIWSISPARCGIEDRASGVVWVRAQLETVGPTPDRFLRPGSAETLGWGVTRESRGTGQGELTGAT